MHCNCLISIIKVLLNFILIPYSYHLTTNLINKIIIIIFFPGISKHKRNCNEKNQNKYTLPLDLLLPFLPWIQWLNYKMTKVVVCCNCCNIGGSIITTPQKGKQNGPTNQYEDIYAFAAIKRTYSHFNEEIQLLGWLFRMNRYQPSKASKFKLPH